MTDVALIRSTNTGIRYTRLAQTRDGSFKRIEQDEVKMWDMKHIIPDNNHFRIPTQQYSKWLKVLASKEGKEIVNNLKNKRANEIVNEMILREGGSIIHLLKDKNKNDLVKNAPKLTYPNILKDMLSEPLIGNNQLPHHTLHITHEDIFNEFINEGLL